MRKRLLAILLTLGMALALLPTSALAYVGAKWDTGGAQSFGTDGSRFYMENDYIYFSVFNTSPDFLELKAKNDTSAGHSGITLEFFVEYPGQAKREMSIESATLNTDGAQNSGMVTAVFTFGNDHYQTPGDVEMTYTVKYQLVRLDEGDTGRGTVTEPIMKVDGDDGTTWALFADGEFEFKGEALPAFDDDEHAMVSVRASLLWFSNFGHPEYDGEVPVAPVMLSKADRDYSGPVITDYNTTNISQGLDWMATNPDENDTEYYITEAFVDSYTYANPFVATSQFYNCFDTFGTDNDQGVWGFEDVRFPTQICYERDDDFGSNYAYSCLMVETETAFHEPNNPQTADLLIGYRDLVNTQEDELPTDPDKVTVSSSADRLAVYADGTVTPYSGSSGITGNPVAVIRGDFELKDGAYNFTGGAAALSPTVTATWSGSGSYFRIKIDGTVEQSGVHLNAPSFKFYLPQSDHADDLSLSFNSGGLQMSNMSNNDAVLNIDLPGTSTSVTSGTATVNGGLSFKGKLSFNNMFSQEALEMTELSYALKNGVFTVNGVRANGTFDSVSLLGFTLGEVTGSIDTIDDVYDFEAEINVFSLLEASGELQLKRTDSGELMPNNLYFEVDSAVGIPLVPPVPVVKLTGGGAGFYGLADTANGDWYAIPPLKFRGSVDAEIVEFLAADGANIVLGPSEFELSVDALKIAGTSFAAFSGGIGMYLGGDKVTYNSTEYTGLSASGRIWLDIDLPSQRLNFLVFDGELAAGIFGGMHGNDLYLRGYGNSRSYAELQFPDSWPLVGGWNLLGVGVDTAVVADTLIQGSSDYGSTIESAFDNLNLQVGLAATGSFLGSDVRVWVILPDVAQNSKEDYNWGWDFKFWGSLDRWSWDNTAMGTRSANAAPRLLALAPDTTPALLANGDAGTASKTITVSDVDNGETAYLVLSFPENTQIDLDQVSVIKNNDVNFSFTPEQISVDGNGAITNSDTANIISDIVPLADGSGSSERVLIIKVGEGTGADGTYTVSFGGDEGTIEPEYSAANVVAPADRLGDVTFSGNSVSSSVEYPEDDAKYVVRTYLSTTQDGGEYLVSEATASASSPSFSITIPTNGTAAPTGNYYVTTYLLKEISYTPEGASNPEKAYIAIGSDSSETALCNYTNTSAPAAPTTVELKAVGNEVMTASWKAPANATNVGGYKIVIYEQDGNGNWVDSGFGYEYDASQFIAMPGLNYDENTQTYSIDMALTMGGASSEDGTAITLPAGKSYKVGVSAYNSEAVTIFDETQNVKYYGPETQNSAGVLLPEYEPLDITMRYYAVDSTPFELMADTETGIYSLGVSERDSSSSNNRLGLIQLSVDKSASYTVTRMDDDSTISVDRNNEFYIPDFEGMLMLEITGSVTSDDGITDTTTRYLLISRDDTAPIITLDEDVFYADENGSYTITGVTEPGAIVEMSGYYGESVAADTDGTFSLTGTLTSGSGSALLAVTATDTAGNEGTDDALVTTSPATTGPSGTVESVTVSPASANVARGGQQQFTATVVGTGTYDHTVTWSVTGNASTGTSITSGGLLTVAADETAAHLTVTATSSADSSKTASSTVTVGTYILPVPSYRVTIGDTANGTVTASPATARQGATVTLTVTPEEGYAVDELTVTDFFGSRVDVTRNIDGTYSFVMPYSQVEVYVTFTRTEEPIRFTDVPEGAYYYDAVYWAVENGVTVGATATTFNPGGSCTRAQMVTFLWRAAGSPEPATTVNPFTDVDANDYYYEAVLWAVENGVTVGATATTFNPGGECTRSQMVTFLWRAAGEPGTGTSSNPFTDVDADDYYCEAVLWAVENGITVGATATTFAPVAVCTRAQAVTFLYRAQG